MSKLQWFEIYTQAGLKPIAIFKERKVPVGKRWNCDWTPERWRPYFNNDDFDMGILLGEIVDVEGDTEEANYLINQMTNDVPHPMFQSSKSTHHLFLNPDPLLTRKVFNGIEFRANKHQSVVPPSTHEYGFQYGWLAGSKFKIPKMPEKLFQYYKLQNYGLKSNSSEKLKDNHTQIKCEACKKYFFIHKKRLFLELKAFHLKKLMWTCRNCRDLDVRQSCRNIRKNLII